MKKITHPNKSRGLFVWQLPVEKMALGYYTPAGIFFVSIKLTVPLAYFYILLILVRELCEKFPGSLYIPIQTYLPYLASVVSTMQKSSTFVEVWAIIEALFYICLRLHIQWLQYKDPLEASLSSAPMLELWERRQLWERIMEIETDDPVCFVTGWFFDQDLQHITVRFTTSVGFHHVYVLMTFRYIFIRQCVTYLSRIMSIMHIFIICSHHCLFVGMTAI
jgi:hypothetical protein